MRPVIEKKRLELRHIFYIIIIFVCIIAIAIAVYTQYFKDEKLGVIFGITSKEEDEEVNKLKENFFSIFTNDITIIEKYEGNVNKIKDDLDLVSPTYNTEKQEENYLMNLKVPGFNINSDEAKAINTKIRDIYKQKAESVEKSKTDDKIIYNVRYKVYENNNILSLIIISEFKEGDKNQRIIMQTFNYDLKENKDVKINALLEKNNIDENNANKIIKEEIDKSQEQNVKLKEIGYDVNVRDSNSEDYKIQNAKTFFIGENGYLYVIYPYGNKEATSEMDIIILK